MTAEPWRIVSTGSLFSPGEEYMRSLLLPLPEQWEPTDRFGINTSPRQLTAELGHLYPEQPDFTVDPDLASTHPDLYEQTVKMMEMVKGMDYQKYDYICNITIVAFPDAEAGRDYLQNRRDTLSEGTDLSSILSQMKQAGGTGGEAKKIQNALAGAGKTESPKGINQTTGKYLGYQALFMEGSGNKFPQTVLAGSFVVEGTVLVTEEMKPGSTKTHSLQCRKTKKNHKSSCTCQYCLGHGPCSTLAAEALIHRECAQDLIRQIFEKLKDPQGNARKDDASGVEITRPGKKSEKAKKDLRLGGGCTLKTKKEPVTIADESGNEISLGADSELTIEEEGYSLEMAYGEITARVKNLPEDALTVKTPVAILGVRGTAFTIRMRDNCAFLQVFEGEVEFSGLSGTGVSVKSGYSCTCSEGKLGKPKPSGSAS